MSLKRFFDYSFMLIVIVFLFCISKNNHVIIKLILACLYWRIRTKDITFLYLLIILCIILIPRTQKIKPDFYCGKVIEVKEKYSIIQNHFQKIILYSKNMPILDSEICYYGEYKKINITPSFYQFQFGTYANQKGIYYAIKCDHFKVKKESNSLRGLLQKRILKMPKETYIMLYKIIYNISYSEQLQDGFLKHSAVTFSGIFAILNLLLKNKYYQKERKRIDFVLTIGLCFFYHFPQFLIQRIIFKIFDELPLSLFQKLFIAILMIELIYPNRLCTLTFCLPIVFRILRLLKQNNYCIRFFYQFCLQSILFYKVYPLQLFCFRLVVILLGLIWYLAILYCFIPIDILFHLIIRIDYHMRYLQYFPMHGTIIGFGFIFYVILIWIFRKYKYYVYIRFFLLLVFHGFGLFHPLAEVTIINVGQGDSILVRSVFNLENQLIDTGKPNAFSSLEALFSAKGITNIKNLYITHQDLDHCGNQDIIKAKYNVKNFITQHSDITKNHDIFPLQDLNDLVNNNKNQSGFIQYVKINGLKYLFMGDADFVSEKHLLEKYPNLKCDILKVSHHGSKYGSSNKFLSTVDAKIALISCGRNNIYQHPHPTTLQRFKDWKVPYLTTKEDGDISIFCLPFINLLITASGKIAII